MNLILSQISGSLKIEKKIIGLLGISFLVKILLAYLVPVFADEAYYYIWTLKPQLSYFDHPPMVSWLITLSSLFFSGPNPLSLRLFFVILSFFTCILWIYIFKNQNKSNDSLFWFFIFLLLNPLLGVGSILATPDTPLVFFWTLSFLCFLQIFKTQKNLWYGLLGVALGLGFCAKYHIVLFVISGLVYLLLNKRFSQIRPFGVLLTLAFGFLFTLPVVIWNAQNNWSSFLFQINHGFNESGFHWTWPLNYILGQIFIFSPFVFFALFQKPVKSEDQTYSFTQLVFFTFSSFKSTVEANWPISSNLHSISHFCSDAYKKWRRPLLIYWLVIYSLVLVFWVSPYSAKAKKAAVNSTQTETLLPLLSKYQPLYGPSYQVSSLMSWQSGQLVPKLNTLSRYDFFDTLPESQAPLTVGTVFYVLKIDYGQWPPQYDIYKKTKLEAFDNLGLELYQFNYE